MRRLTLGFAFLVCWVFFAIGLSSCEPTQPSTRASSRDYMLDPETLHRSFTDQSDRWVNQRITLNLPANSYTVLRANAFGLPGRRLAWCARLNTDPPAIVFDCEPPLNTDKPIRLKGVCVGTVKTAFGWYVSMESCTIMAR